MSAWNEFELRQALRALPRRREPTLDLWPRIASAAPARGFRPVRWAMAAGFVSALALAALLGLRSTGGSGDRPSVAQIARLDRVADAMMVEYESTVLAVPADALPGVLRPAANELDANVRTLRAALGRSPESRLLIRQLQFALEQRMRLAQRVV